MTSRPMPTLQRRQRTSVMGALLLVVVALAVGGWTTSDDPGGTNIPAHPPAPGPGPTTTLGSAVEQSRERPTSAPLDPDDFVPPVEVGEPFRLVVPGQFATGPPPLENVNGIVVHERLAPFIRTLLAEAEVAGVALEGGGYRDSASQRRLRAQNYPDPINSPASACSPPTAKVGQSLHEYGLAIDFTSGGDLILDRGSAAYRFLEANGGWSGLEVHPREPWHWSYRP